MPYLHFVTRALQVYGDLGTRPPDFGSLLIRCLLLRFWTSNCDSIPMEIPYHSRQDPFKVKHILRSANVSVYFDDLHPLGSSRQRFPSNQQVKR
jgi:hypothetical protein